MSDLLGNKQNFNINHPVIVMKYLSMINLIIEIIIEMNKILKKCVFLNPYKLFLLLLLMR